MKLTIILAALLAVLLTSACSASYHRDKVRDTEGEAVTVGTVQREIRRGMAGGDVAAALGSPNIVSTDENGNEVWIWDKISTERVVSDSSSGIWLFGLFVGGSGGGAGSVGASGSAGASSTSQRTLTVIVKFDEKKLVRDVAYHTSRF